VKITFNHSWLLRSIILVIFPFSLSGDISNWKIFFIFSTFLASCLLTSRDPKKLQNLPCRQAGKSRQNDGYSPFWLMRALPFSALCNKSTIPDKVSKLLCRNSMTYSIHPTHGSSLTLKLQRQRAVLFAIAHEDRRCQAYAQHSTPKKLE